MNNTRMPVQVAACFIGFATALPGAEKQLPAGVTAQAHIPVARIGVSLCAALLWADEPFFSGVNTQVNFQTARLAVSFCTTLIGTDKSFSCMDPQVPYTSEQIGERLATALVETDIGLCAGVITQMLLHISPDGTPHCTALVRAGIRFFAGVNAQVNFQGTGLAKRFGAVPVYTTKGFVPSVSAQVQYQLR